MIDAQDIAALAALALGLAILFRCVTLRKRGGLCFWRIGRLGGCFYIARRVAQ